MTLLLCTKTLLAYSAGIARLFAAVFPWTSPAMATRSKLCWLTGFPLPGALMATISKMDIGDVD